ncbi:MULTISPECIES: peptidase G2 autoproteolytic cleavage domain-containing protein [unclassified Bacillus (in: firmicutes)]|uniref:peptidase G2 autoproteolytic cleavage domain-containing protein n=1 Tax=unclassified Bacillus (in: firmicutes) TaxID=185979 RepID=UPI001BECA10C|nr:MULTISPECIES: peptidase G2 autoproteolytic cleavage domain-containing protein [unclassified Bacillus (in: firmicutes)]MBT2615336.1 peptidase G2 [Bacillus sp. ISL-78]MBT2628050.1 peptidase G2 [Bacillus sp. ISL-101]
MSFNLIKNYDPTKNAKFLSELDQNARYTEYALNQLLGEIRNHILTKKAHDARDIFFDGDSVYDRVINTNRRINNLILNTAELAEVVDGRLDTEGVIHPVLKDRLDKEYNKLKNRIDRVVNVKDFGAVGDGVTDDSEAFKRALGNGRVRLLVPAGTYIIRGLKLPSWTYLIGDGKGLTILKLHEDTPAGEWVITNNDYLNGNRNIFIQGMSLDWNSDRQGGVGAAGGQKSSCLTLAKVSYGWIKDVEAINAGLHGFDITSPVYNHASDTDYTKDGCRYIWIDGCVAYGYGDDGITTHYSEYVFISNNFCVSPSGNAHEDGISNSNGVEVDDGSKHVWLTNNFTSGNIRGVEVKAHADWPASQDVHIIGHVSYRDVRSYDFRHIGHHAATDPVSTTAFDINVTNCTAIEPIFNGLYEGLTPRALAISAYQNVAVSGFTAIGDPNYDYQNNPVIAIQYKSRNIGLHNINIRGFKKASTDIRLFGGDQNTDYINISNIQILNSAKEGIGIGGAIYHVNISNVNMINDGSGETGLISVNSQDSITGVFAEGYANAAMIAGNIYKDFVPNNLKGGTRIASSSGQPSTETSAIISSTVDCKATGDKTAVIASSNSEAAGEASVIIGSSGGSKTEGGRDVIIGSNNSRTPGKDENGKIILASNSVVNDNNYSVRGGYGASEIPTTANAKWELDSMNGNIKGAGSITGSSSFSDYAEYFESVDGKPIKTGTIVTLENEKIKAAVEGDHMLGVISETAGVVLGEMTFHWKNRYILNEFGGLIYEETTVKIINDETGEVTEEVRMMPKENPEWIDGDYLSREERPEWNIVGLLGQVYVRIDGTVEAGNYIRSKEGIATRSEDFGQGWRIMKITSKYDPDKGYGIALCFIR